MLPFSRLYYRPTPVAAKGEEGDRVESVVLFLFVGVRVGVCEDFTQNDYISEHINCQLTLNDDLL